MQQNNLIYFILHILPAFRQLLSVLVLESVKRSEEEKENINQIQIYF